MCSSGIRGSAALRPRLGGVMWVDCSGSIGAIQQEELMCISARTVLLALAIVCLVPVYGVRAADEPAAGGKKKIVFLAGRRSHAFGDHEHFAGCALLAKRLSEVP